MTWVIRDGPIFLLVCAFFHHLSFLLPYRFIPFKWVSISSYLASVSYLPTNPCWIGNPRGNPSLSSVTTLGCGGTKWSHASIGTAGATWSWSLFQERQLSSSSHILQWSFSNRWLLFCWCRLDSLHVRFFSLMQRWSMALLVPSPVQAGFSPCPHGLHHHLELFPCSGKRQFSAGPVLVLTPFWVSQKCFMAHLQHPVLSYDRIGFWDLGCYVMEGAYLWLPICLSFYFLNWKKEEEGRAKQEMCQGGE